MFQARRFPTIQLLAAAVLLLSPVGAAATGWPNVVPASPELYLAPNWIEKGDWVRVESALRAAIPARPTGFVTTDQLLFSLHIQAREDQALIQAGLGPADKRLLTEADYLTLLASAYADRGDHGLAMRVMRSGVARLQDRGVAMPRALDVQFCRLLIDRDPESPDLYKRLVAASQQEHLTSAQIEDYRELWIRWSLAAADEWRSSRDFARAVSVLESASEGYPDEGRIHLALGRTYLEGGRLTDALELFEMWGACEVSVRDCERTIAAAIRTGDGVKAEAWLRKALRRWPRDPSILILAGRHSALWGWNDDARRFWKRAASLTAANASGTTPGQGEWESVSWSEAIERQTEMRPRSVIHIYGLGPEPIAFDPEPAACSGAGAPEAYCVQGD